MEGDWKCRVEAGMDDEDGHVVEGGNGCMVLDDYKDVQKRAHRRAYDH